MSSHAERIIDLYERHARAWINERLLTTDFYERGWMAQFCALLPAGGCVLDLGCGAGEPIAKYLAGEGYTVTGVDSSRAMIAMFRARSPEQRAMVADMRTLALGQRFHGILAWDSFFRLNYDDQRRMFSVFRAHAAPGAALMFTSGPAHGEVVGQFQGEPLYHASLDPAEYRSLLNDTGFEVVANVFGDETCGGRAVWLARRRLAGEAQNEG